MNIDLMIAVMTQVANYFNLIGSMMSQAAAEIVAGEPLEPLMEKVAVAYNVMGSQLLTMAAVIYYIAGQLAINQLVDAAYSVATDGQNQSSSEENTTSERPVLSSHLVRWRIKRVKHLRRRQWRIHQHYRKPIVRAP